MDEENGSVDNFYGETKREELVENDEISPEEEGFMKGYEDAESEDSDEDDEEEEKEVEKK